MRGIQSDSVTVSAYAAPALLPPEALCLLDQAASIFAGRAWWDLVLLHAMPAGSKPLFVVCASGRQILCVIPLLCPGIVGTLSSLTTPYTGCYTPMLAGDADTRISALAAFLRFCRVGGVTRIDALPAEWDGLPDLLAGSRRAGLLPLCFDHFGNWHEDVSGQDWSTYLAARPGKLRQTIRRRLRQASRRPDFCFAVMTTPSEMDMAAEAFESVYARSWKASEPYPTFNVSLMRAMAERGLLRFSVWSIGTMPVAVQIWVVDKTGCATVLKLAHDEAFKTHSPGTVLTALTLRYLLQQESIREIDFGRGDEGYKQGWARQRRQRIGLLLVNPWTFSGGWQLARHTLGKLRAARLSLD